MTRANTPDSLSTRTEIVALRIVVSGMSGGSRGTGKTWVAGPSPAITVRGRRTGSDQYQPFVGDAGGFVLVLGAEDHLVVRCTARDHREAVLLGVHPDVGDDRAVGRQHFPNDIVHLLDAIGAQAYRMEAVGQFDEVRQRRG